MTTADERSPTLPLPTDPSPAAVAEPESATAHPGAAIDRFDREMIDMLLSWAPYGDPPEDECLPTFGMRVYQVKHRIGVLIAASPDLGLDIYDRTLLVRAAKLLGVQMPPPRR
jgi:hypothetical protein